VTAGAGGVCCQTFQEIGRHWTGCSRRGDT
jgi:hypothetical protein